MPYHKARKINNQQNKSSIKEEPIMLSTNRMKEAPASLNRIPKQES